MQRWTPETYQHRSRQSFFPSFSQAAYWAFIHWCLCLNTGVSVCVCNWDRSGRQRVTILFFWMYKLKFGVRSIIVECWDSLIHESQLRRFSISFNKKCMEPLIWYEHSERTEYDQRRVRVLGASRRVCFILFVPGPVWRVVFGPAFPFANVHHLSVS